MFVPTPVSYLIHIPFEIFAHSLSSEDEYDNDVYELLKVCFIQRSVCCLTSIVNACFCRFLGPLLKLGAWERLCCALDVTSKLQNQKVHPFIEAN